MWMIQDGAEIEDVKGSMRSLRGTGEVSGAGDVDGHDGQEVKREEGRDRENVCICVCVCVSVSSEYTIDCGCWTGRGIMSLWVRLCGSEESCVGLLRE